MQDSELEPIMKRLVMHVRRCQDALSRAIDQLEDLDFGEPGGAYIERQVLRAKNFVDKALWDCRELPGGDAYVNATCVVARAVDTGP